MGTSTIMTTFPPFLPAGPSLQTPKPTQPYNDPRYHHLLESRSYPQRPQDSSPSSSNPSPSSTLCSSGSGTTLVLDEAMVQIKKAFELWPSESRSSVASSSKEYMSSSPSSCNSGNRLNKVEYQSWMLNPGSAFYAPLFLPIDSPGEEDGNILDTEDPFLTEQPRSPISSPPQPCSPIQRPPKRQRTASYRHVYPRTPWSESFQRGCRSRNCDAITRQARKIVNSQRWDEDDDILLGLVHAFVRHAIDVNVEASERENIAAFARRVRDAFRMALPSMVPCPKKRLDVRFKELMRETVLGTFVSCWHHAPEHLNAITYTLSHTPPPSYISYVTSALHLCSFIGDLYTEKLLSRTDTVGCVRVILHNLSIVDHITAIGNILKRAGTALWKEASFPIPGFGDNLDREVDEFEEQMRRVMCVVQDHRYLFAALRTDEPPGKRSAPLSGVVERKVESLIRYVRECRRFVTEGCAAEGLLVAISPE